MMVSVKVKMNESNPVKIRENLNGVDGVPLNKADWQSAIAQE
jgi:hypothetical protein